MKICRFLFAVSACLSPVSVLADPSPSAGDWKSLDSWVQDTLTLTESFESGIRGTIQKAIEAAVQQIKSSQDSVLRTVWIDLLRFGSTLHANFSAWKDLEAFDYEKQINGETLTVDDPVSRKALSEALLQCTSLELLAQRQVNGIQQSFESALQERGASNDGEEPDRKYGPMRRFLRELEKYMAALQGQTELIHRKRILEAAALQGDETAPTLLVRLNDKHQIFYETLEEQFSSALRAAHKCQELGLLLDGTVAFMMALNEL